MAARTLDQEISAFTSILFPRPVGWADPKDRFEALYRILRCYWPSEVDPKGEHWNPWTERSLRAFCDDSTASVHRGTRIKCTYMTGAAACSKTWTSGWYAFAWWMVSPRNSTVIFTSTTRDMIKRRIWPSVQYFHDTALDPEDPSLAMSWPFDKTESRTTIEWADEWMGSRSAKDAIMALAVAHGETQKAAHNLRGVHNERVLLVIDEANGTPEAIFETIPNLRKGCADFQVIIIGNPISRLDPHGQCCAPADGWSIVTETMVEWLTRGVDKWQIEPGLCLRFDGRDSPNVKLGEDKWPFIYTCSDWHRACQAGRQHTLAYWSQDRGLHPPDGFTNTIFTETALEKHDPVGGEPFTWHSTRRALAFLDPAFGGDECKLYFGDLGDVAAASESDVQDRYRIVPRTRQAIQVIDTLTITFDYAAREERDYIIARRVIQECKARGVAPEDFGIDRTGTGRGVAAIICAEWSPLIHQIEFGSVATERAASTADLRPAKEIYSNRSTEMCYSAREFLVAGQLRGIPLAARVQLCLRTFELRGRKYLVESKEKFKLRLGYSPDDSDCLIGLCDVARNSTGTPETANLRASDKEMEKLHKASQVLYQHVDYSDDADRERVAWEESVY